MLVIPGFAGKDNCDGVTRRELLRVGGSALLGLSLADLFRGEAQAKKKDEQAFPTFETFRENIEGHFWFPTYTRADDVLHFKTGPDVRIRVSVKYTDYKRFGSTIKIGKPTQVDPEKP